MLLLASRNETVADRAASRLVQRADAIELLIWRLCCEVAQTVWRPPTETISDRHKSTRSRRSSELTLGTCRCRHRSPTR